MWVYVDTVELSRYAPPKRYTLASSLTFYVSKRRCKPTSASNLKLKDAEVKKIDLL